MKPLTVHSGIAAVLDRINVDTDQIIPKQFLKAIGKAGFGKHLFSNWRYLEDGSPDPEFPLNDPRYAGASILLAGKNFGCGSSREHAPWSLGDYGFRVIVAESYGDIFQNNCYKNGILPVVVSQAEAGILMDEVRRSAPVEFVVDLPRQRLLTPDGLEISFEVNPFRKEFLLKGIDDVGWILERSGEIEAFEERQKREAPWLWSIA